jgi:hypothetical protein
MKFEIHFEFRGSLRKFQDLNFWDATKCGHCTAAAGVSGALYAKAVSPGRKRGIDGDG